MCVSSAGERGQKGEKGERGDKGEKTGKSSIGAKKYLFILHLLWIGLNTSVGVIVNSAHWKEQSRPNVNRFMQHSLTEETEEREQITFPNHQEWSKVLKNYEQQVWDSQTQMSPTRPNHKPTLEMLTKPLKTSKRQVPNTSKSTLYCMWFIIHVQVTNITIIRPAAKLSQECKHERNVFLIKWWKQCHVK